MSYTIYYDVMSVKLSKGNKYIPMVLSGDNNVRRYDGSRARSWNNISGRKGKVFFTTDELMEETKHIIDTNEYLSELIVEAKSIMKENESFYQNFEIRFNNFTHFSLISHDVDSQKKAVGECSMFIECILKSNVITEDNK